MPPEIQTLTADEERSRATISPFAEVVVAMVQSISALWNAILHPPSTRAAAAGAARRPAAPRSTAAEEPSA